MTHPNLPVSTLARPARRLFVANGLKLSAAAVALLGGRVALAARQPESAGNVAADIRILNGALQAEHRAIAAYQLGADSGLLRPASKALALQFQGHHRAHAALRRHEGGKHLPPLRVVQRLDKDTSGVMVLARTRRAERELGQQLRRHDVHRVYLGIAYGRVAGATHDTMLVPDRGDRRRGSWRPRGRAEPPAAARRAITHVELVEHHACADLRWAAARSDPPGLSLVRCRLETGRQHQIRIHLGEDHHPLVGERVYDRDYEGPRLHDFIEGRGRPMLHAAELGFRHPSRDLSLSFCADLPSDFADLLHRMRASGAR